MKQALKVTFGAMVTVCVTTSVYAQLENDLALHSSIAVTGTYTQSSNNGFSMGDYQTAPTTNSFLGRRAIFIDPDSEFDYGLAYTYRFPHCPSIFFVTYDHYRTDDNKNDAIGPVIDIGIATDGLGTTLVDAYGRMDERADEVRFGFGHFLDFSPRFHMALNGFFEWDKVRLNLYETALNLSDTSSSYRETENKVEGWGPGVGAFGHVRPFCNLHWGFFVDAKTTLLWAENEFTSYKVLDGAGVISSGVFYLNPEESESLVGKLDLKIGIDYCRAFHGDMGNFIFEAALGLRYMNMFNAIKNGNTFFNPLWPSDSTYAANTGYPNDWGRFGPFLTFKLGGENA